MAISFVGASNLIATNGGAPGAITVHANTVNGNLLVWYHYSRATGGNETVAFPAGWTEIFNSVTANQGLVAAAWRIRTAGDTTYTATITNHTAGTSGETVLEWIETFNGHDTTTPIGSSTASLSTWASSLNLGPISAPASASLTANNWVVVFGGRFENIAGQTTLTGDSLTWAQGTRNDSVLGLDAGAVTQHGKNLSGSSQTITSKTITTTGTAQAGAGRMFIINAFVVTPPDSPYPKLEETLIDFEATANQTALSVSVTPNDGDLLVVKAIASSDVMTFSTPSGGGFTYTSQVVFDEGLDAKTINQIWTAPVPTSPGAMTVTLTVGGSNQWHSMVVERWSSAQLDATPVTVSASGTGSAASTSLTTEAANSVVSWCVGDWTATDGASRAYGDPTNVYEEYYRTDATGYTAYYLASKVASAESETLDLTAPTNLTWVIVGIEIQRMTAAAPSPKLNRLWQPIHRASFW